MALSDTSDSARRHLNSALRVFFLLTLAAYPFVQSGAQLCGDADNNGIVDIMDISAIYTYVTRGGEPGTPLPNGNADGCGSVDIADAAYLARYFHRGGPAPCDPSVVCAHATGANRIWFGCPVYVSGTEASVVDLPIYITNNLPLMGFTIAIAYDRPDVEVTEVDISGSVVGGYFVSFIRDFAGEWIYMYGLSVEDPLPPQTGGLLATLRVSIPANLPQAEVNFVFATTNPGTPLAFAPLGGGTLTPAIGDCGTAEIINPDFSSCGDADGNDKVDLQDITAIINYLKSGTAPGGPLGNSDADGCGSINIADAAYLAQYRYHGGPSPCDPSVICDRPIGANRITLGCPQYSPANTARIVDLPIYVTTDIPMVGFSVALGYNSRGIEVLSVDTAGSVFPVLPSLFISEIRPENNEVVFFGFCLTQDPMPPKTRGLLATLHISIPADLEEQEIDFGFISTTPSWGLVFAPLGGGTIVPAIEQCGNAELKIRDYLCGDADGNGYINIKDIAFIVGYLYKGGPAPDNAVAADVNNSGAIELLDITHLIGYLYKGGMSPNCP